MLRKWLLIVSVAVILVAGCWCVALTYAFSLEGKGLLDGLSLVSSISSFGRLTESATVKGIEVGADVFLTDDPANEGISADYARLVDFGFPGMHEVVLTLRNDGSSLEKRTLLYVLEPARSVEFEAGSPPSGVSAKDFIVNLDILPFDYKYEIEFVTDIGKLEHRRTGVHDVELKFNGIVFHSEVRFVDTTPPVADTVDLEINTGAAVAPDDFLRRVTDVSSYKIYFSEEPDVFLAGRQKVIIVAEDIFGNRAEYEAQLVVIPNTSPPVFNGVKNIEAMLGESIRYRADVTAEDSFGNALAFEVDNSGVDTDSPGVYEAVYVAEDANGNATRETITVTVAEISEEMLFSMVDAVMGSIIKDGMTQTEAAQEIYNWIRRNIGYTVNSPKENVFEGAYFGFKNRSGDCYIYYSVSEIMLTRAGIPNMRITRIEGTPTRHYWNLINPDDAGWYHFDTTPTRDIRQNRFMFTDTQAEQFSREIYEMHRTRDYYTYVKDLYPEIVQ